MRRRGHPAIEYLRGTARPAAVASHGAYEPHEVTDRDPADDPHTAAECLVDDAVRCVHQLNDPYAGNSTDLVVRITQPHRCGHLSSSPGRTVGQRPLPGR